MGGRPGPPEPKKVAAAVFVSLASEQDLAKAIAWYEERASGLGSEFLRSVEATLASIGRTPALYPRVHGEVRRALLRRFPYGDFYVLRGRQVRVVAFFHASRNPRAWQAQA